MQHPIKVLVTAQSGAFAGVERRLLDEIRVLRQLGAEVILAPARFPGAPAWVELAVAEGAQVLDWQPYKFIERGHTAWPARGLAALSRFQLRRQQLDLAHVALPWTRVGLTRVHELAVLGVPVTLGLHCTYPRTAIAPTLLPHLRRALAGVVGIYAVSEAVAESFRANYGDLIGRLAIGVIRNGIALERFRPDPIAGARLRATLDLPQACPLVAFCGRLDGFKNPMFALHVMAQVMAKDPDVALVLIGDGPLAAEVRAWVAASPWRERIRWMGFQPAVGEILAGADLYLSTSGSGEGCPLAPAEALACGVPAVVPNWPAFTQTFAGCAGVRVVDAWDPAHWAGQVLLELGSGAATDPRRKAACRSYIEERLGRERMVRELAAFYSGCLHAN